MQINYSQAEKTKPTESKKDSVAFRSHKIITDVSRKITDKGLKVLGAATGAIAAATIAMNKKAQNTETREILEIPKAYDPIVQESLDELVKEHGKKTVALALKVKNIDVTSKDCDQYSTMKIHELLKLTLQCETEPTEENLVFLDSANNLMQRHLLMGDPRSFIPLTLKKIKPEARKAFIKWLEFCNKKAEKSNEPVWYDNYEKNDKKDFIDNITAFIDKNSFQEKPEEYLELFLAIEEKRDFTIQENIDLIFNRAKITSEKVSTYIEILNEVKNIKNNSQNLSLHSFYYLINDEKIFLEWIQKTKPIFEKLGFDYSFAENFYTKYQQGEISEETIKQIVKDIETLSIEKPENNLDFERKIILKMLECEPEKYDFYKEWLHKIDKHITTDLWHLKNTKALLEAILFDKNKFYYHDKEKTEQYMVLYKKLFENTEVLQALQNKEIVLKNSFFSLKKTESHKNILENIDQSSALYELATITYNIEELKKDFASTIYEEMPLDLIIENLLDENYFKALNVLTNSNKTDLFKTLEIILEMKNKTLKRPDLYLNSINNTNSFSDIAVDLFYSKHNLSLYELVNTFDKETIETLMRKRLDNFEEYLISLKRFNAEQLSLLKRMVNSCNIDGKPFLPTQKIDFINLLEAYNNNNISTEKIEAMIESGRIDVAQLNLDLFYKIMKNVGFSDEKINSIPKEKLFSWDIKLIHKLAKEFEENNDITLKNILHAGIFENDFVEYIHNSSNIYGQTNEQTKKMFDAHSLNYEKWIRPSKDLEISFSTTDKNVEQLSQIAQQLIEDMNVLMQSPAKTFIKKQFPKFVKEDSFIIPNEYITSKTKLKELIDILSDTSEQGQLSQVWKRAQNSLASSDSQRTTSAKNTLTILDHLEQRKKDIANVEDTTITKNLDLTIKMWDRIPQKDLFQGNYSTCCIGIGNDNGIAMPHYLANTMFNMIEIIDNSTGRPIGNALCYFVIENNQPALIIDNIEINNSIKPSNEAGKKIRNQIVKYASRIAESVTGNCNTPIYLGTKYNDVPVFDLLKKISTVSLLGEIDSDDAYLDLYGGWILESLFTKRCEMFRVKVKNEG